MMSSLTHTRTPVQSATKMSSSHRTPTPTPHARIAAPATSSSSRKRKRPSPPAPNPDNPYDRPRAMAEYFSWFHGLGRPAGPVSESTKRQRTQPSSSQSGRTAPASKQRSHTSSSK